MESKFAKGEEEEEGAISVFFLPFFSSLPGNNLNPLLSLLSLSPLASCVCSIVVCLPGVLFGGAPLLSSSGF